MKQLSTYTVSQAIHCTCQKCSTLKAGAFATLLVERSMAMIVSMRAKTTGRWPSRSRLTRSRFAAAIFLNLTPSFTRLRITSVAVIHIIVIGVACTRLEAGGVEEVAEVDTVRTGVAYLVASIEGSYHAAVLGAAASHVIALVAEDVVCASR